MQSVITQLCVYYIFIYIYIYCIYIYNFTFICSLCLYDCVLFRPEDDDFDIEEELQKLRPAPRPTRELEPRSRHGLVGDPRVTVIPEDAGHGNRDDEESEESDSDGPINYRDDDVDEEDVPTGMIL